MAEQRTSLQSKIIGHFLSLRELKLVKLTKRVLVVPTASGQIDFIGPRGASLNTNIISMTSLCLPPSVTDSITLHHDPLAITILYSLGMF